MVDDVQLMRSVRGGDKMMSSAEWACPVGVALFLCVCVVVCGPVLRRLHETYVSRYHRAVRWTANK